MKRLLKIMIIAIGMMVASGSACADNIVIVICAGHDEEHTGAAKAYNGRIYKEDEINFRISELLKAELETYVGVTVYLSRENSGCPAKGYPLKEENKVRVDWASTKNADYFIDVHCNAGAKGDRDGAQVYFCNSNFSTSDVNPMIPAGMDFHKAGYDLSWSILNELQAIGMEIEKPKIRFTENVEDPQRYPDGTPTDYYATIRRCKENGIIGVIIEHGYMDGKTDLVRFLSNEEGLQALALADARGIANFIGLSKDPSAPVPTAFPPRPTMSPIPNATPTNTPVPSTGAEVFNTPRPFPTATSVPLPATPTSTPKPTNTPTPTKVWVPTNTPTPLPVPETVDVDDAVVENDGIRLYWTGTEFVEGYYIYRKSQLSSWDKVATVTAYTIEKDGSIVYNPTQYSDYDLKSGLKYIYYISGFNRTAEGEKGANQTVFYNNAPEVKSVEKVENGNLICWDKCNDYVDYTLYKRRPSELLWTRLYTTSECEAIDLIMPWMKEEEYEYAVRCIDKATHEYASGLKY